MTQNAIAPLTARFVALRRERATFERTYKAQAFPETFKRLVLELYRDLSQLALMLPDRLVGGDAISVSDGHRRAVSMAATVDDVHRAA